MPEIIKSLQNNRVKYLVGLKKDSRRKKEEIIIVEGIKENQHALENQFKSIEYYICPGIFEHQPGNQLLSRLIRRFPVHQVSIPVYNKLAYRGSTEGIIGIYREKKQELDHIELSQNPFILVAESIEKPGNLGALVRTADAADMDAVIISNPRADVYNPNVIRASLGCVFTRHVITCNSSEAVSWLKKNQIQIVSTHLEGTRPYHKVNYNIPTAIVMGTEATGLSETWKANSDQLVIIPMKGKNDSLNVSVSAAIVIFEGIRQRETSS
ncbi:MAG: TrmH family RNA methyltransferase [Bacteroidota bacterium]